MIAVREIRTLPARHAVVTFLDVGQGDSALLVSPSGRTVLIDGGPDLSALEQVGGALPLSDQSIDLLILSHPDPDHFTAFPEILRRFEVGALLLPPIGNTEEPYRALIAAAQEEGTALVRADPFKDIDFGDGLLLDILWPPTENPPQEDNDASLVLRASFATGSVLFTGDLGIKGEAQMLLSGIDVAATVLKVGHHGSRTSTSDAFLAAVHPSTAVISAGKDNHFGHPHTETLNRLASAGIRVRQIAEEGPISLSF